jgi:polar amino acid transport system permease protein
MSLDLDFDFLSEYWPQFLKGALVTIELSAGATVFGFLLGLACAVASTSRFAPLRWLVLLYVEVIRNTPMLVQLFLVFFGLATLGLKLSATTSAIVGLVMNIGAYSTEIIRAGIESIRHGQIEAAEAMALSRWQILSRVVLPPALERVYPALTSQYVLLMLGTSTASQISAEELTAWSSRIQSDTFRSFEVFIVAAVIYIALSFAMRGLFALIGRMLFVRRHRLGTPI